MTTTAPPERRLSSLLEVPQVADVRTPRWLERLPVRWTTAGALVVLMALSAFLHSRYLGTDMWFAEAGALGAASHSLGSLFGVLRAAGYAPLYYVLLHFWMDVFGTGVGAARALSLVLGVATVPISMWLGWSLAGRRAGMFAAVMFAFSAFLVRYSQEAQPYVLTMVLGLLATAGFLHGFVYGRRRWLWLFGVCLSAMLWTEGAALLYWMGAAVALGVVAWSVSAERRSGLLRDALLCFGGAALLYVPWLPTTISQIAHNTYPWHYAPLLGATVPSQLLGAERVDMTLLVGVLVGAAPLWVRARRRSPEAVVLWTLAVMAACAFVVARLGAFVAPVWAARYFAAIVAPLLLFVSLAAARARVVGLVVLVFCVAFLANYASFAPSHKSSMRDVAGELGPMLHAGDVVVVGQPEQTPLAWYYLPGGLRYWTDLGPAPHPSYMNWSGALGRLRDVSPASALDPLVATLRPGQQLLYVRPLTEGVKHWSEPWTELVRRRSAQWGQILSRDVADGTLQPVAWAPHNYPSACCVADAGVLYQKKR